MYFFLHKHNNNSILYSSNSTRPFVFLDLIPMCACIWEGVFPTPDNTKQFLDTSSVSKNSVMTLSARRQHQIPQVEGCPARLLSTPHSRGWSHAPGSYVCFLPTGCTLEGPMTCPLGLINLLELLPELRKTLIVTSLIKDTTKNTS